MNIRSLSGYIISIYVSLLGIFIFNRIWSQVLSDYDFGLLLAELRHVSITALVLFLPLRFYVLRNQNVSVVLIPLTLSLIFYCVNYIGIKSLSIVITTLVLILCSCGATYMTETYVLKGNVDRLSASSIFKATAPIIASACFLWFFDPTGIIEPLIIMSFTTFFFMIFLFGKREIDSSLSISGVHGNEIKNTNANRNPLFFDPIFIIGSALITYASNFLILDVMVKGDNVVQTLVLFQTYMMLAQFGSSLNNITLRTRIANGKKSIFFKGTLVYGILIGLLSIAIWKLQILFFKYVWGVDTISGSLLSELLVAFGIFFCYRYIFNYILNIFVEQGLSSYLFWLVTLELIAIGVPYSLGWRISSIFYLLAFVFSFFALWLYANRRNHNLISNR